MRQIHRHHLIIPWVLSDQGRKIRGKSTLQREENLTPTQYTHSSEQAIVGKNLLSKEAGIT